MKKIIFTLVTGLLLGLAGCFDIKDEIFLEEKGNGTFQSTIDMSGMKDMIGMLKTMMPDSLKEKDMGDQPDDLGMSDSIMSMWKDLEKIKGISEVKREKKSDYVFTISFRFADIKALNTAMGARSKNDTLVNAAPKGDFFSFSKGQFTCNDTSMAGLGDAMKGLNSGDNGSDSAAMNMAMLKAFMGDMKYTHVYHLPGKVQSVSNKDAKLSEDGKTVTLELDLSASDRVQSLQNVIRFR
ncbi:MAG: hypothetical protein MUE58_10960 [Chitinophagaceae bacterium]|jgi:hypothetical protein|nr:hypothetical protein [Chitinophagaceae bacterium]